MTKQNRVFITGGASGLGRALAMNYVKRGFRVCVGDVQIEAGQKLIAELGASAHFIKCDVTQESDLIAARTWLESNWSGVDLLYNNAGVAAAGDVGESSLDDWNWLMNINLMGVVRGCHVFTPLFRRQGSGHIVNIASLAGLVHSPQMAAYNCSKAAVVALTESLYFEFKETDLNVSVVCPSFFRTNLSDTGRTATPDQLSLMTSVVKNAPRSADQIAEKVIRAVAAKRFLILTDADGYAIRFLKKLLPFSLFAAIFYQALKWQEPSVTQRNN